MVTYHPLFQKTENQILLAAGARSHIRAIGLGGILWGLINLTLGVPAYQENPINAGLIALGALMLSVGILALRRPSRGTLLAEACVSLILLLWNSGIAYMNMQMPGAEFDARSIIFPLAITLFLFGQYRRLRPIHQVIGSLDGALVKKTIGFCTRIFKLKTKEHPELIACGLYRILFEDGQFVFSNASGSHAFIATTEEFRDLVLDPGKKKLKLQIDHPLTKISLKLDKKATARLLAMFAGSQPSAAAATPPLDEPKVLSDGGGVVLRDS